MAQRQTTLQRYDEESNTTTVVVETKPGVKTTEFWVTMAVIVATLAETLAGNLPEQYAAIALAVSAAAYAVSRALAKR